MVGSSDKNGGHPASDPQTPENLAATMYPPWALRPRRPGRTPWTARTTSTTASPSPACSDRASGRQPGVIAIMEDSRPHDLGGVALMRILQGHHGPVRTLSYTPDGRVLASGGDDGVVKLWNPGTGELVRTLGHHTEPVRAVAFHPDRKKLATGPSDATVRMHH